MRIAPAILLTAWLLNAPNAGAQNTLPNGAAKDVVQTACSVCHQLNVVTNAGHTPDEWNRIVGEMVMKGALLTSGQVPGVEQYLASNFPPKARPQSPVLTGTVQASFKEWPLPSRAFPHDPYAAADGLLWYSGQFGNLLGRLDPKTGQFREYPLKTPSSGPHGLVGDRNGNIWFTANFRGYIGKLDPKTGQITEYKVPGGRDPHTPLFDQQGILWFTVQGSNLVGRLDPATGEVKTVTVPTPGALPYGMVISSKGVPFFAEFGSNKLASIDPKTMQITEYVLPNRNSQPRRIAITSDDVLWYGDYGRGYLGSYDPKTGKSREWKSPGGADAEPYGITALNDVIWYSESGVSPNTLVRFDPKSEKFQTWKIPSGGGTVRNMMPTPDGKLVLAESGENKIALVDLK
jgi:virginiamycin B lyase